MRGAPSPVVYSLNESEGENAGYRAAQQLLQAHPDVDGVLVLIDTFASGAVRAFRTGSRYPGADARGHPL